MRWAARVLVAATALLLPIGCADPNGVATPLPSALASDRAGYADLSGDGDLETILFSLAEGSLVITDGADSGVVYRVRDCWRVVQACLGDTNGDGRAEVVALLDADDGRHLGLFAYFAGEYRERLVTREFIPAPVSVQVVDRLAVLSGHAPTAPGTGAGSLGDIVVLTLEATPGQDQGERVLLRWNGFSFTQVEGASQL